MNMVVLARSVALALALSATINSAAPPTNVPYKCFLALLDFCAGETGTTCETCAGTHSAPLLAAGCSAADITEACETNLLRRFNLTIANTQIDGETDSFTYLLLWLTFEMVQHLQSRLNDSILVLNPVAS